MKQAAPQLNAIFTRHIMVMLCVAGLLAFYYASTVPSSDYYAVLAIATSVLLLECVYGFKKLQQLVELTSDNLSVHSVLCKTLSVNPVNTHNSHPINKILLVILLRLFCQILWKISNA